MSCSHVFEWHKQFKEGYKDVEDDSRSGRPSTSRTVDNVEHMKQMSWKSTVIACGRLSQKIWVCRSVKMVPKLLDNDQKEWYVDRRCVRIFLSISKLSMTQRPRTKAFSGSVCHCQSQRKARQLRSKIKLMLIVFFDERNCPHGVLATGSDSQPACL